MFPGMEGIHGYFEIQFTQQFYYVRSGVTGNLANSGDVQGDILYDHLRPQKAEQDAGVAVQEWNK